MNKLLKISFMLLLGGGALSLASCSGCSNTHIESSEESSTSTEPSSSEVTPSSSSEIPHTHTGEGYEHDENNHWKICTICGEKFDEAPHNYGGWEVDKEPTIFELGSKHSSCTTCNYIKYENIPGVVAPKSYSQYGDYIHFGRFPQSIVNDAEKIAELNEGIELPTYEDPKDWTAFKWYYANQEHEYAFYRDLDKNNDGQNDYRGVVLLNRRPELGTYEAGTQSFQTGFELNRIYWYSYDPIEWDVLTNNEDGTVTLITKHLISSEAMYGYDSGNVAIDHNGGTGYASSYALSDLRKWLNEDFYNFSINDLEKPLLQKVIKEEVNSARPDESFIMEDYFYIPSIEEVQNYNNKIASATRYSRIMNIYRRDTHDNGDWWLRDSNEAESKNRMYGVSYQGEVGKTSSGRIYWTNRTCIGVRPTVTLKLPINVGTVNLSSSDSNYGTVNASSITAPTGDIVNLIATTKAGCTFIGWFNGDTKVSDELVINYNIQVNNPAFEARFVPNPDTRYYVHHLTRYKGETVYVQISALDETKYGTTGELTEAVAREDMFDDYNLIPFEQKPIGGDGNTVVEIKYDWKKQPVTIVSPNHCTITGLTSGDYDHGLKYTLHAEVDPGYTFVSWMENDYLIPDTDSDHEYTVPNNPIIWTCKVEPLN